MKPLFLRPPAMNWIEHHRLGSLTWVTTSEKENPESQTVEKKTPLYFSKMSWQFSYNKIKNSSKSYDRWRDVALKKRNKAKRNKKKTLNKKRYIKRSSRDIETILKFAQTKMWIYHFQNYVFFLNFEAVIYKDSAACFLL